MTDKFDFSPFHIRSTRTVHSDDSIAYRFEYNSKSIYIPAFHSNKSVINLSEKGEYALYHGNLAVAENRKAVDMTDNPVQKNFR